MTKNGNNKFAFEITLSTLNKLKKTRLICSTKRNRKMSTITEEREDTEVTATVESNQQIGPVESLSKTP